MGNAKARKQGQPPVIPKPQDIVKSIAGGLDQAAPVAKLREYMESIVKTASSPKTDLGESVHMLETLNGIGKLSALGTAAVLWNMRDRWEKLSGKKFDNVAGRDTDFQEFIFITIGYMTDTTRRYCLVMDFLNEAKVNLGAKSEVWESLLQRDIKDLIGLGQYTTEHGLLTKKQLGELALEPDSSTLRKKLNEYKGKEGGDGGAQFVLHPDGTLEYWKGDEVGYMGYIQLDGESKLAVQGRAALIRRAKIMEK